MSCADQFQRSAGVLGPMQASADHNGHVLVADPLCIERFQQGRKNKLIGHRAGDVANGDRRLPRLFACDQMGEAHRGNGMLQGLPQGLLRLWQGRSMLGRRTVASPGTEISAPWR